jgi:hypothetical protein
MQVQVMIQMFLALPYEKAVQVLHDLSYINLQYVDDPEKIQSSYSMLSLSFILSY